MRKTSSIIKGDVSEEDDERRWRQRQYLNRLPLLIIGLVAVIVVLGMA